MLNLKDIRVKCLPDLDQKWQKKFFPTSQPSGNLVLPKNEVLNSHSVLTL